MAKKRKKRRGKKRFGGGIIMKFISFCVICFAILGATTVFFKIQVIDVTGESPYTPEAIIESSGIQIDDNTFFVNKFNAISKIFARHPYLDEISMKRHLPSRLEIIVSQCVPTAVISGEEAAYIIDYKGKVLEEIAIGSRTDLIQITGVEPDEMAVGKNINFLQKEKEKTLLNLLNELEKCDIIREVKAISLEKLYNLTMEYKDKFTIYFGSSEGISEKIKLISVVEGQLGPNETGTIDVSDNENIRFRPK